jgi:site-specific recombinase XerD
VVNIQIASGEITADNVLGFADFFGTTDYSTRTRIAFATDLQGFARWFEGANGEGFDPRRVTVADVASYRDHLRVEGKAVATVNRRLNAIRAYLAWAVGEGLLPTNPGTKVKELKRQALAPKGLERAQVRKILRESELRRDHLAHALFSFLAFTGCRASDLVGVRINDLALTERTGKVVFRNGKGGKERTVPLPAPARGAIREWLKCRPQTESPALFVTRLGGGLSDRWLRGICEKYAKICGFDFSPHTLRHSYAKSFLESSSNDLVSLMTILGHESIQTTARYALRSEAQLAEAAEKIVF